MQSHILGKMGIQVSADGLGAMMLGAEANSAHQVLPGMVS